MKKYKQLDQDQRYKIRTLLDLGYNQRMIAEQIGVHRSTISRELKRNTPQRGRGAKIYKPQKAQEKAIYREKVKNKHIRLTPRMLVYIRKQLREQRWSPELISAKGKIKYGDFVSHEIIYQYIWKAKHSKHRNLQQDRDLHSYLRHWRRRRKRSNRKGNRGCIPNRTPISERPDIANTRDRIGDIEVDLMMGKAQKPGLIVLTDRSSLETHLIKINTKKSELISSKIVSRLRKHDVEVHTMTFDNDMAFAKHEKIGEQLQAQTYFTRPYTSQDKGTVENRIGVIRRFFPKGTDISQIHHSTIKSVERKLNNRPIRKFDYLSPREMKLYY